MGLFGYVPSSIASFSATSISGMETIGKARSIRSSWIAPDVTTEDLGSSSSVRDDLVHAA